MKTPYYETSPGAVETLLFSPTNWQDCDLYTIKLFGGGEMRYATGDFDVQALGNTWSAKTVLVDMKGSRPLGHWKVGLDVDTWQVTFMPRPVEPVSGTSFPDKIGNQPWLAAVRAGALDGAEVQVDRAFFTQWPAAGTAFAEPTGIVTIFYGRVANIDLGRSQAVLTLNSHLELLNISMPRNLFMPGCRHTLFDVGCTLDPASFSRDDALLAGSTQTTLLSSVAAPPGSGTYALGRVLFTSGENLGYSRMVRSWTPGTFTLLSPLPFLVAPGDTFTAFAGCNKTMGVCSLFGNLQNFGGFPFIPAAETAV